MDALVGLIISLSVTVAGGIVTAVKEYKQRKSKKKLKKRLEKLEQEKKKISHEPIHEAPQEDVYAVVEIVPQLN